MKKAREFLISQTGHGNYVNELNDNFEPTTFLGVKPIHVREVLPEDEGKCLSHAAVIMEQDGELENLREENGRLKEANRMYEETLKYYSINRRTIPIPLGNGTSILTEGLGGGPHNALEALAKGRKILEGE